MLVATKVIPLTDPSVWSEAAPGGNIKSRSLCGARVDSPAEVVSIGAVRQADLLRWSILSCLGAAPGCAPRVVDHDGSNSTGVADSTDEPDEETDDGGGSVPRGDVGSPLDLERPDPAAWCEDLPETCAIPHEFSRDQVVYACTKLPDHLDSCEACGPHCVEQGADVLPDCFDAWCGDTTIVQTFCPSDRDGGTVCCQASALEWAGCVDGRPLTVQGKIRVAPVGSGTGWCDGPSPDLRELSADARQSLAAAWSRQAQLEHASVASFSRLAMQLLALGAPADLVADAQRAAADEIAHARLCFALASAYAGEALRPGPLDLTGALTTPVDLAKVAADTVREGCIGETIAALEASAARESATDPVVRSALEQIAREESEHARMAWRLVEWALRVGGDTVRRAVDRAFAEQFAAAPDPADADDGTDPDPHTRAHGRLDPAQRVRVSRIALGRVVAPCRRALAS